MTAPKTDEPNILDVREEQKVSYCIPTWLRDEQIKHAIARVADRIQQHPRRPEPVAVVAFGPSLNDTWEEIRKFDYIISCSGSHKFLLERGIVPTWHVEVDPRQHKVGLMGPPHPDVEYLIASTCHPKVFDHLEGHKVRLWHVFDTEEEGLRILPYGEWAITGGCNVGLRALTIAGFFGFRDLHVFGMDGNVKQEGSGMHAAPHPNQPTKEHWTEYPVGSGKMWRTTPAMLSAAQATWHELDMMPGVSATFYGEGLVQRMAQDYQRKSNAGMFGIAYMKDPVITPTYQALNAQLHRENLAYGVGGGKHAATVLKMCEHFATKNVLDYGCGKGYLGKALDFPIWEYDPAIPGKTEAPRPADIVACTDVLEHIEPDTLKAVLKDLHRVMRKAGYFVIHTGPASKTLPDGRNTHLLQHDEAWWRQQLGQYFAIGQLVQKGPELHVIVTPLPVKPKNLGGTDARPDHAPRRPDGPQGDARSGHDSGSRQARRREQRAS